MLSSKVLTAEEQSRLTPNKVIENLKQGNDDFINNRLTVRNNIERVKAAAQGQYPAAMILSCIDSRVPVEDVFHCGLGDIFVARVAGNIINPDVIGSMEFACKIIGAKLIVVLGHGNCGSIQSAIDDIEMGHITGLLVKIKPAIKQCQKTFTGEAKSSNPEFVDAVCRINVRLAVKEIRENSAILKTMEEKGEIKIIGAMYNINSGKVEFFENI